MSLAKDILRLVNERDRLRVECEQHLLELREMRKTQDNLYEFGESLDPEFRSKYFEWRMQGNIGAPNWDYKRLLNAKDFAGIAMNQRRKFKFETNVPKFELEEVDDD